METKLKFNSTSSFDTLAKKSFFEKNILDKRTRIDFSDALISVDIPEILFNNFFEAKKSPMTLYFKKQYKKIIYDKEYNIFEDYNVIPVKGAKLYKKLSIIIKKTSGMHYSYDKLFFRLKNINLETNFYNAGLQFYFVVEEDKYKIVVIDLFHMVIPAHNCDYPGLPKNPTANYEQHKNGRYNLSNFK